MQESICIGVNHQLWSTSCTIATAALPYITHPIIVFEDKDGNADYKCTEVLEELQLESVRVLFTEGVEEISANEVEHDTVWADMVHRETSGML